MIIIGESQIGTSRKRLIKTKVPEKHITIEEDTIEMGLMEQLNETQIVAE